jgi:hypothetical protein
VRGRFVLGVIATGLSVVGGAEASIYVGADAARPTLGVDAKGTAVVGFTAHGKGDVVVVPARGQLYHGGRLSGPDVSHPIQSSGVPLAVAVRRAPDGTLYALQAWHVLPGQPVELHLARWKGEPTKLTLETDGTRLTGAATFQGKPVAGTTFTLEGKHPRVYVYLDCFACGGKPGWTRMIGVAPRSDGSFRVYLRTDWKGKRFRATVAGLNAGVVFAPDAQTEIAAG